MYKIVFSKTGDYIDVIIDNEELVEYWLSELKKTNKTVFSLKSSTFSDLQNHEKLSAKIDQTNHILNKFKINTFSVSTNNWFNQSSLNSLHQQWVKLQIQYPQIVNLLKKIPNALQNFNEINTLIHKCEEEIEVEYINDTESIWQTKNIFGPEILKLGKWNVELSYQNLGRSTFNKWYNYDDNVVDSDTNNVTHLGGLIKFNIARPFTFDGPLEYKEWCKEFNVIPYGSVLPIGNFNLDITKTRILFYKNVSIENNPISFEI